MYQRFLSLLVSMLVWNAFGCGCGSSTGGGGGGPDDDDPADCSDQDGDGFGVGADCEGPDCNDFVDDIHTEDQCDEWCDVNALSPGCPCDSQEPEQCYLGDADTLGIGVCRGGLTTCQDGFWGNCDGQTMPTDEICDSLDNDCDGTTDEEVTNECGTCGDCSEDCFGPAEECDGWGDDRTGLGETPEGWLVLDGTSTSLHVIWPSSSGAGHIYRVNTETHEVEATFWTGPNHVGGGGWGGDSPSRTAVDDFGNVFIANRAFGLQGSVSKIAASSDTCPDRNGDGDIDTSTGWDDRMAFTATDDFDDECILWHQNFGGVGAVPRALAIHQEIGLDGVLVERGWAGLHSERKVVQFDTADGELTGVEAPTGAFTPYGGALDREGWMWLSSWPSNDVGRFDTGSPEDSFEIVPLPGAGQQSLRVIVDENNAPWISGPDVMRYNRDTEEWEGAGVGAGGAWDFALGNIASDGDGSIWAATYNTRAILYRIENDEDFGHHEVATPGERTFGVGCDFDRQCWAFGSDNVSYVVDIDTEDGELALNDCGGLPCMSSPYVRGDITGLQRRNALNPAGVWQTALEGCMDGETDWTSISIDALTPVGSQIVVSARTADTLVDLNGQPWTQVGIVPADGSDLDLDAAFSAAGVQDGQYLNVRVELQSLDGATSPTLRGVDIGYGCEPIIG